MDKIVKWVNRMIEWFKSLFRPTFEQGEDIKRAPKVILNSIQTPDGTILTSRHRHDYKEYQDKNGKFYMVDGGHEYSRTIEHEDAPYTDLRVYEDDPFEKVRDAMEWGTYGKKGDKPLHYKKLKDMSNAHIEAIIMEGHGSQWVRDLMRKELLYRIENSIVVED